MVQKADSTTKTPFFDQECHRAPVTSSYDHTTVRAPHPIRTAKLSTVGPDQYFGRGLQGNLGCCMAPFSFFALCAKSFSNVPSAFRRGTMGHWRNRKRASFARTRHWDRNPDAPTTFYPNPRQPSCGGNLPECTKGRAKNFFAQAFCARLSGLVQRKRVRLIT